MASLQHRLIETIASDLEKIKALEAGKNQRNEYNLLLKRIESAKKLLPDDSELIEIEKCVILLQKPR